MSETAAERLERNSIPVPFSGCLLWTAGLTKAGYGELRWEGRVVFAHRLCYEVNIGPIPSGMKVCHHCDVRSCIEPSHLFLGSDADNAIDMQRKGRGRKSVSGLPLGVIADKRKPGRFYARRSFGGFQVHLGSFSSVEAAALAAAAYRRPD